MGNEQSYSISRLSRKWSVGGKRTAAKEECRTSDEMNTIRAEHLTTHQALIPDCTCMSSSEQSCVGTSIIVSTL